MKDRATIFDIKHFAVGDGPGIRTTVFFKGCPLRCAWCHNPEGLDASPQLMHEAARCTECGLCRRPCDHADCAVWGRCLHICPQNALKVAGQEMTVDGLAEELLREAEFLRSVGGGVTFSGGEPLLQAEFLTALMPRLDRLHLCMETSGYAPGERFAAVLAGLDHVLFDLKLADPAEHKQWTGVSNEPIHANLARLRASGKPFTLRVPLIPGITDTEKNLRGLAELAGDAPVELLPYNRLAGAKYPQAGMVYPLGEIEAFPRPDAAKFFENAVMRK